MPTSPMTAVSAKLMSLVRVCRRAPPPQSPLWGVPFTCYSRTTSAPQLRHRMMQPHNCSLTAAPPHAHLS